MNYSAEGTIEMRGASREFADALVEAAGKWDPTPEQYEAYLKREVELALARLTVASLRKRRYRPSEMLQGCAMSERTVIAAWRSFSATPLSGDELREVERRDAILRAALKRDSEDER